MLVCVQMNGTYIYIVCGGMFYSWLLRSVQLLFTDSSQDLDSQLFNTIIVLHAEKCECVQY